jgi:replicative DNA helicase
LVSFQSLLEEWQLDAEAAYDARVNKTPRGPISGLSKLDRELGEAFSPGPHLIHGQPGTGKTALALQIAASCGCPCVYVTCEMSPLELFRRQTARVTKTYLGRLKSGEIPPSESLMLAKRAAAAAPDLAFIDATRAPALPVFVRDCAQIVRKDSKHLLIVVDSLHSWAEAWGEEISEYECLNMALRSLRVLAHQLSCPILIVSERNRESMKTGGLSAGAGTRKIEYGAETVLDLSRDPDTRENFSGDVEVKLRLAKNRHGAAGKSVTLLFNGATQSFEEL